MGTLELEMMTPKTKPEPEEEEEEEEISPIEQVRLTVTNTDDPNMPVWTFRMWFLGVLSCALMSFLNQFFAYRTEPLIITQISVQVASLPAGHFLAAVLPRRKFRLGSREVSLNPGPFNIKEHVLISIFANAGYAFGNGSAYAVMIVNIIKAFYRRSISFHVSWILIITTQVLLPLLLPPSLSLTYAFFLVCLFFLYLFYFIFLNACFSFFFFCCLLCIFCCFGTGDKSVSALLTYAVFLFFIFQSFPVVC